MGCCESKGLETAELSMSCSSFKSFEPASSYTEEFHDISLNSAADPNRLSQKKPTNDIFVRAQAEPSVFTQRIGLLLKSRVFVDSTNSDCLLGMDSAPTTLHSKKWRLN